MSNMSYCRFQNTLGDLQDCYEHFDDNKEISADEKHARKRLYQVCKEIVDDFEYIMEE